MPWYAIALLAAGAAALLVCFLVWGNNSLSVSRQTVTSPRLPQSFDGFRILHISDLHNKRFGRRQRRLIARCAALSPHIIAVTGDLIHLKDDRNALNFLSGMRSVAPVYYVAGNHERKGSETGLFSRMARFGVHFLDGTSLRLERGGDHISVAGVYDPSFLFAKYGEAAGNRRERFSARLDDALSDCDGFSVLLSHRPELFSLYVQKGPDLVLSGHAHGGQFRLPFLGGLYAPNQGVLPKYTAGLHESGSTRMVVSRGLGNSAFPLRLFNRPELVLVTLRRE